MTKPALLALLLVLLGLGGCAKHDDYWITGIEVVQASQTNVLNAVPMVADKPTFVRVYLQSLQPAQTWRLAAQLNVHDFATGRDTKLSPVNFAPVSAPVAGSRRDLWSGSFTFWLGPMETQAGERKFDVHVSAVGEPSPIPSDHVWSSQVLFHPRVEDQTYGVVWSATDKSDGTPLGPAAPWSDYAAHTAFVRNVLPVSKFSVVPIPGIGTAPPNPQPFSNLTQSRIWATNMLATLPAGAKINLLDNWDTGGLHGLSWGKASEEQNARDNRVGKVMAQEISHSNGLPCHTQDPCDNYPNSNGQIDKSDIGFNLSGDLLRSDVHLVSWYAERDIFDQSTANGAVYDFMSYNNPPIWVSSYTYCQEVQVLWKNQDFTCIYAASGGETKSGQLSSKSRTGDLGRVGAQTRTRPGLLIAGFIDARHVAHFGAFEVLPFTASAAPVKYSQLTLELLAANGQVSSRGPVDVVSHAQGATSFSAILPLDDRNGKPVLARLVRGQQVLGEHALATRAPDVSLSPLEHRELRGAQALRWKAHDPENRPLRFTVLFSRDNGVHWQGLNVGIAGAGTPVNADVLPGSDIAWFKVRASNDGASTESAPIGPYHIDAKPPTVAIDGPIDGATISAETPLLASATAFSWQDGPVTTPSSFHWKVDGNREIQGGSWTVVRDLAPGPHTLEVTVRDAAGLTAQAAVRLVVKDHGPSRAY